VYSTLWPGTPHLTTICSILAATAKVALGVTFVIITFKPTSRLQTSLKSTFCMVGKTRIAQSSKHSQSIYQL
jgi:hypothetical protein